MNGHTTFRFLLALLFLLYFVTYILVIFYWIAKDVWKADYLLSCNPCSNVGFLAISSSEIIFLTGISVLISFLFPGICIVGDYAFHKAFSIWGSFLFILGLVMWTMGLTLGIMQLSDLKSHTHNNSQLGAQLTTVAWLFVGFVVLFGAFVTTLAATTYISYFTLKSLLPNALKPHQEQEIESKSTPDSFVVPQ